MENPLYVKIAKWISWALLLISVGLSVWAFTQYGGSGKEGAVETMLYWAYAMLIIAIIAVLCIGLAAAAVLCLIAYLLASGAPALGATSKIPTAAELKLTDTVLNLTYILGAAAIVAVIAGEVIAGVLKNKA